jgi:hypothetical protein
MTGSLALSGCSNVKDTLGLNREGPDEYRVVARPPLSVPPDFELRPPGSFAGANTQSDTREQARSLVLRSGEGQAAADASSLPDNLPSTAPNTALVSVKTSAPASPGEEALLQRSGAANASSSIREELRVEEVQKTLQKEEKKGSFLGGLREKLNKDEEKERLDAAEEKKRLQEARRKSAAMTQGSSTQASPTKETTAENNLPATLP